MVKLRLTRIGRHKRVYYRLVATDSRNKVEGGYIELLGHYDPLSEELKLYEDKILKWLSTGAQPSETVKNILKDKGIWAKFIQTKKTAKPKSLGKNKVKKTSSNVKTKTAKPKKTTSNSKK